MRTKRFSLRIITLVDAMPSTKAGNTMGDQIIRSGTSVGADYRAAFRAKSDKDFLNKMVIIEEEADETCHWLELLQENGLLKSELIQPLLKEADELTAIFTASGRTIRERLRNNITAQRSNGQVSEPEPYYNPESEIRNPEFL